MEDTVDTVDTNTPTVENAADTIPVGIDPLLAYVWQEKRRREKEAEERRTALPPLSPHHRHRALSTTYAAYIGIIGMLIAIVFGFLQERDPNDIIDTACISLLGFALIGYVFGWVAEFCVRESVVAMLREMVERSDSAA